MPSGKRMRQNCFGPDSIMLQLKYPEGRPALPFTVESMFLGLVEDVPLDNLTLPWDHDREKHYLRGIYM